MCVCVFMDMLLCFIEPLPRYKHSATLINVKNREYIMVFGGRTSLTMLQIMNLSEKQLYLNDVHLLSTDTWEWKQLYFKSPKELPVPRFNHTAFLISPSELAVWGGCDCDTFPYVYVYVLCACVCVCMCVCVCVFVYMCDYYYVLKICLSLHCCWI